MVDWIGYDMNITIEELSHLISFAFSEGYKTAKEIINDVDIDDMSKSLTRELVKKYNHDEDNKDPNCVY